MEKMSVGNLVILGFLMDRPISAYEMANLISTQIVGQLVKISAPTVYKNIKQLSQDGYLEVEAIKESEMPEKKVYTVTEKGKQHFYDLMVYFSQNQATLYFDFNAFLINIEKVDRDTGLALLNNLKKQIEEAKKWITEHEEVAKSRNIFFAGRAIVKQYRMITTTLVNWINEVIEEYQSTEDLGKYVFNSDVEKFPQS